MTIPTLPDYVAPFKPVPQVTPFTLRDGTTMLNQFDFLERYINLTLVPFVNDNYAALGDDFETEVNALIEAVNAAIAEVIDSGVTVQDAVVAGIFGNPASATRVVTDQLYGAKSVVDALVALTQTGRLSVSSLDATYAHIADLQTVADNLSTLTSQVGGIQNTINTGRLSDATLHSTYISYAPAPTGNRTTDTANLQALIDAAQVGAGGAFGPSKIYLKIGTYKVTGLRVNNTGAVPTLIGAGPAFTSLEGDGSVPVLTVEGNTADILAKKYSTDVLTDCKVSSIAGNIGIEMIQCTRVSATRINFDNLDVGVRFHNRDANMYTEFCTVRDSWFGFGVGIALAYKLTSGHPSFHGSGLTGNCVIDQNSTNTQSSIIIGSACRPYNAPMEVAFMARSSTVPLITSQTNEVPTFYGHITVDNFVPNTILATKTGAEDVRIAGPIMAYGQTGFTHGAIQKISNAEPGGTQKLHFAEAAGSVNITAPAGGIGSFTVTLPAGRFLLAPMVTLGLRQTDPTGLTVSMASVTANSFDIKLKNTTGASVTTDVHWYAVQMSQGNSMG